MYLRNQQERLTMISPLRILQTVLLCLLLTGCFEAGNSSGSDAIEAVQDEVLDGQSNNDLVNSLAGRHGKVTWLSAAWGDKQSDQLTRVSATIQKNLNGTEHVLVLEYRYDHTSKRVVLDKVLLDDQVQSVISGAVAMLAMKLE
ncbi:hypothetical protein [Kiloniella antarctica]|uniref:Lipoprotein n=1 Tax=Kiloniella antarctica TaxID=1550907 RepID=A0ABW5BG47_9PROT